MTINTQIGLLSTLSNPLLPIFINKMAEQQVDNVVVICDSKNWDEKSANIWKSRTNNGAHIDSSQTIYEHCTKSMSFYFVGSHNSDQLLELCSAYRIECLVNAGTPRKISRNIIDEIPKGIVNIHPGALPSYKGSSAVEWSILNNHRVANTAHFMNEEYDSGPIIEVERYAVPSNYSYQQIRSFVYIKGCELAAKTLLGINKGDISYERATIQNPDEGKYWPTIPEADMQAVLDKIRKKTYSYD